MLNELLALVLFVIAGASVGAILSSSLAGLFIGVGAWVALQFVRLLRLSRWLATDVSAVPDNDPRLDDGLAASGLWGNVYRSVARLKQAAAVNEEDHRRVHLEEGVAALPYGFVIVTREGRIEWFNAAASRLLHLSHPDDMGREITNLIRQPDFVAVFEGSGNDTEVNMSIGGKSLTVYASLFGGGTYRLIAVQDLSQVRYLERARSELLGNVAHELKTPLTVIRGYADIIASGKLPAENKVGDIAGHISRQAERMNCIVEDLLMLERLEERPLQDVDPVELRRLINEVVQEITVASGAGSCRFEVSVEDSVLLHGDRSELHSVLSNLIANAVRYSPDGGVVRVYWSPCGKGGWLSVADEGIGIDPAHLPRLTERFYRADRNRSRKSGGAGLGLAIVKHVLQRHGASLHIESSLGKGSVFHCDFPISEQAARQQ